MNSSISRHIDGLDRNLLISIVIVGLMSAAAAGTYATFVDSEQSAGNDFAAGTMDMKIRNGDDWQDGIGAQWTLSNMVPGGDKEATGSVDLRRDGSIAGDYLTITAEYDIIEEPHTESDTNWNTPPDTYAADMKVTHCRYYNGHEFNCLTGEKLNATGHVVGTAHAWNISDVDDDSEQTLYDMNQRPITDLTAPGDTGVTATTFDMHVTLSSQATNSVQGDTLNATVLFTMEQ